MNEKLKQFREDLEALTGQYWDADVIIYADDSEIKILIKKKCLPS